ncbi:MAG: sensor histidine kinase [Dehalococcoidia bacterium]
MDIIASEHPLEEIRTRVAALPTFWRRRPSDASYETLPGGIRLAVFTSPFIVRWATWFIALLVVLLAGLPDVNTRFEPWLLIGTFIQLTLLTFYVPVLRPALLARLRKYFTSPEQYDVLVIGLLDLALALMALYLSGGWRSPYFHFALTALLIPSFFLTFRAVVGLGLAYMLLYFAGVAIFGDGVRGSWADRNLNSFIGAIITPMLIVLVPSYLGSLLRELDAARRGAEEALADNELQYRVARAFLEGSGNLDRVLPGVARAALEASRFDHVALITPGDPHDGQLRVYGMLIEDLPDLREMSAAFDDDGARTYALTALPPTLRSTLEHSGWLAAVPLRSAEAVEGWLIAATLERPISILHEVRLLDAVAGQIALGIRNVRLTGRVAELAAESERTRIAREIHDGIAQMVYMLSLSLETAVDRVGTNPEEQRQRLKDLTTLAKNALWEVRQYIFDLRPLLSGDEGLVGAIQGQVKEFQAVSELPVELEITGDVARLPVETSAALYRIVQEGLGNIFRHAQASQVRVGVRFAGDRVTLSIEDDGIGIPEGEPGARVGYGMGNLRDRVDDLSGTVDMVTSPGEGTRIEVSVPIGEDA